MLPPMHKRRLEYYLPRSVRDRFAALGPVSAVVRAASTITPRPHHLVEADRLIRDASPPGKAVTVLFPVNDPAPPSNRALVAHLLAYEETNPEPLPAAGRPPTDSRRIYLPECPPGIPARQIREIIAAAKANPAAYPPVPPLARGEGTGSRHRRPPARTFSVSEADHAWLVSHVGDGSIGRSVVSWLAGGAR